MIDPISDVVNTRLIQGNRQKSAQYALKDIVNAFSGSLAGKVAGEIHDNKVDIPEFRPKIEFIDPQ